jgi:hypothetical protein
MLFAWLTRNLLFPQEMTGSTRKQKRNKSRLLFEALEDRVVPATTGIRPIDEVGNNLANPTLGTANTDLIRTSPVAYADGTSAPSLPDNPSARLVSNILNDQSDPNNPGTDLNTIDGNNLTDFGYVWGQFIDHDMDLTPGGGDSFPIDVPPGDPIGGAGSLPFSRSQFDPNTGTDPSNPRQQVNAITSFLDLSQVYGSTAIVADALRTHSGGLMKTSPGNMLPFNNLDYFTQDQLNALNMANDSGLVPNDQLYAAGDVRANENVELTAMQTLFVRNHNRIATELAGMDPKLFGFSKWTDERLYQEARKINIAEAQIITYRAYLPDLLGGGSLTAYAGYNSNVDPSIATEFSTVAFRFGHSMLDNNIERHGNDGLDINDPNGASISLAQDFFDPSVITPDANGNFGGFDPFSGKDTTDIDPILKGITDGNAQAVDLLAVQSVRDLLFGNGQFGGQDLMARDVQRARDHGIGTYNDLRIAYGLDPVTDFSQISSDPNVQAKLQQAYGTVDNIDPFEGGLAEDHAPGSDMGPLFTRILADQFQRLRDGDRFFYLAEHWTAAELGFLHQADTLGKVIELNTGVTNLQTDVFVFRARISGTVFLDKNGDGVREIGERGLAGFVVNLVDDSGTVIASTTTDRVGHYSFTNQTGIPGTGNFTVQVVLPPNAQQTSQDPGTISISRGGTNVTGIDFGVIFVNPLSNPL